MWRTRAANSAGRRGVRGAGPAQRGSRGSADGGPAGWASSRAAGRVRAAPRPWTRRRRPGRSGRVVGGDRRGGDEDPALAVHGPGLGDAPGGEPEDGEGADEVDLDHAGEGVQVQGTAAGEHAAGCRHARAADRDAQGAQLARRVHRGLRGVGVGDVAGDEADARGPVPESSLATTAPGEEDRSAMTAWAPASRSVVAVARPSPPAPPVTRAADPVSFMPGDPRSRYAGRGGRVGRGRGPGRG